MDSPGDFDGNTWVAFVDLCGTKAMYAQSPKTAARAKAIAHTGAGSSRELHHAGA